MATYPSMLAGGVTAEGSFDPAELFAGESDIVTDRGVVGAADIAVLTVVARNEDGLIVAWDPLAGAASKAGTFSGVGTAEDTITVNGVVFTLKAAAASSHEVTIGATATLTAANFAAKVNAIPEEVGVRAVPAGTVVTLYALTTGFGGNNIAIAESGSGFSFAGGATALSGGADERESLPIGIAAQPAAAGKNIPFFTGGVYNHAMLVWPATITTLVQRKAAFDRTNIQIDKLIGVSTAFVPS